MSSENGPFGGACYVHVSEWDRPDAVVRLRCRCGGADAVDAVLPIADAAARCGGPVIAVLPATLFALRPVPPGGCGAAEAARAMAREFGMASADLALSERAVSGVPHLLALPASRLDAVYARLEGQGFEVVGAEPEASLFHRRGPTQVRRGRIAAAASLVVVAGLAGLLALGGGAKEERAAVVDALPSPEAPRVLADAPEAVRPAVPATGATAPLMAFAPEERSAMPVLRAPLPAVRPQEAPARAVQASRSVSPELREAALAAGRKRQAAAETLAVALAAASPMPRPAAELVSDAAPDFALSAPALAEELRPMPRPVPQAGAAPASDAAAGREGEVVVASLPSGVAMRPMARPIDPARQIEQAVAQALSEVAEATAAAPEAAAPQATAPRPEPRRLPQAPQVARVAPNVLPQTSGGQRSLLPAPAAQQAASQQVAPPQPVRQQAVPAQPARQQAAPVPQQQVARVEPQRQQAPAAPAPSAQAGGGLTLIGVFGTSSQRHALVRLPGGGIQRVRPGETVAGVQIAAVGQDNVRVRAGGREGLLRIPD